MIADRTVSASVALLKIGQVASLYNVHPQTIRSACAKGELKCYRAGQFGIRRFKPSDVEAWLGIQEERSTEENIRAKVVVYGRVSTNRQAQGFKKGEASDLTRQIDRLKAYGEEQLRRNKEEIEVYCDTASGLSFTRKGFMRLVGDILAGRLEGATLLVTHKDRLARFGVELFLQIAQHHHVEVIFTESSGELCSDEEDMASDILSIVTCFSSRAHSKRAMQTVMKSLLPETIARAQELSANSFNLADIVVVLNQEGHKTDKGTEITYYLLKKYLIDNKELVEQVVPPSEGSAANLPQSSFHFFHDEMLIQVEEKRRENGRLVTEYCRLQKAAMYSVYVDFCEKRELMPLSYKKVAILMTRHYGYDSGLINKKLHYRNVQLKAVAEKWLLRNEEK